MAALKNALLAAAIASVIAGGAIAQTGQTPPDEKPVKKERPEQKIERIHHEDGGATIDELRVGGQTQSVTVQPKANVPAYEMPTEDLSHSRPTEAHKEFTGRKQRVWTVLGF